MTHYFTYISMKYVQNNSLDKAIAAFLMINERCIFPENQLQEKKDYILSIIKGFNETFPRCNPVKPYRYDTHDGDFALGGVRCLSFHLYRSVN